jgi:hypothetical protein
MEPQENDVIANHGRFIYGNHHHQGTNAYLDYIQEPHHGFANTDHQEWKQIILQIIAYWTTVKGGPVSTTLCRYGQKLIILLKIMSKILMMLYQFK